MLEQIKFDFKQGKQDHFRAIDGLTDGQVKWLINRVEELEKYMEKLRVNTIYTDKTLMEINQENKRYRQIVDFLKLKLVDFERGTEMIRRMTTDEIIKKDAKELIEDILDTLKSLD